ncbi:PA14 domain-containing protein [Nitratiruptor tergarcus DSM 16512]|uniref:PA14 domain-containing protein n=2 Tax=Nitratiruptor tergarcus TaxID=269259 RepID=A0A1W1WV24_9BACT|nr:PA14 domain-containing protein [Nitratiruptor tergarcus]SMC10174.1 PA14 domain-containing protein [Nitratiruptor tergarcus DSM 16512]
MRFDKRWGLFAFAFTLWLWIGYSIYIHSAKKIFKVTIIHSSKPLHTLNDKIYPDKKEMIWVEKIFFPRGNELKHPTYGYLGYKKNFVMRIDGDFLLSKDAPLKFVLYSDDGVRLVIDGKNVLEFLQNRPFGKSEGIIYLKKGKHHLHIDYFQGYGQLGLVGYYAVLNGLKQIISDNNSLKLLGNNSQIIKFIEQ